MHTFIRLLVPGVLLLVLACSSYGQTFFGVDPASAIAGDTVELVAENLDPAASYTVTVGETPFTDFSVEESGIRMTVPPGATSGTISLTLDGVPLETGASLEVLRPVTGNLVLPSGVSINSYSVGVFPDIDEEVAEQAGAFSTLAQVAGANVIMAVRDDVDPLFAAIITGSQTDPITIDATSTAIALAFLSPLVSSPSDAEADSILATIAALPETATLAGLIESKSGNGTDYLGDPEVEAAQIALYQALQSSIESAPAGTASFLTLEDPIAFKSGTPRGTYILEIDEGLATGRSTLAELASLEQGQGYKLTIKEIAPRKNPANWNVQLWELDPDQFELGFQDVLRNHQGTVFDELSLGTIDVGFLPANLAGDAFKINFLGKAVDFVAGLVMSSTKPQLAPNEFRLPRRPGIYVVRSFSGNLWYRASAGIISTESQANILQQVDTTNASNYAFASNLITAAVDVIKAFYNPGKSSRQRRNGTTGELERVPRVSETFEGFIGELFYSALQKSIDAGTQANDTDAWYNILLDVTKASLSWAMNQGLESLKSTQGVGDGLDGKLGKFISGGTKLITGIFDIFGKAELAVNTIQRAGGMFGPNALALERTLVVIGNPFDPEIYSFQPTRGRTNDLIRIYGKNFGSDSSQMKVSFVNLVETQVEDNDPSPPATTLEVEAAIQSIQDNSIVVKVPEGMEGLDQDRIYIKLERVLGNHVTTRDLVDERFRTFDFVGAPVITTIETSPVPAGGLVTLRGEDLRSRFSETTTVNTYQEGSDFANSNHDILSATLDEIVFRAPFQGTYEVSVTIAGQESETRLPLVVTPIQKQVGEPPRKLIPFVDDLRWVDEPDNPTVTILEAFLFLAGERAPTQHLPGERIPEGEVGHIPPTPRETDKVSGDAQFVGDPVTSPVTTNEIRLQNSLRLDILNGVVDPTVFPDTSPLLAGFSRYDLAFLVFDFSNASGDGFVFDGISGVEITGLNIKNTTGQGLVISNNSDGNVISQVVLENIGSTGITIDTDSTDNQIGTNPLTPSGSRQSTINTTGAEGLLILGGSGDNLFYDLVVRDAGTHGVHFVQDAFRNRFLHLKVINPGLAGIRLDGAGVTQNTIEHSSRFSLQNFVEDAGTYGLEITNGAQGNFINPGRVFNSTTGGILISGAGTNRNVVGNIGLEEPEFNLHTEVLEQTTGFGIRVENGAQRNVLQYIAVGGLNEDAITITGPDTDSNILSQIVLGYAEQYYDESGSVQIPSDLEQISAPIDGNGIVLSGGASGNWIHAVEAHQITRSGVLFEDEGTDDNRLINSDLRGGNVASVHLADGPKRNIIGGDDLNNEANLIIGGSENGVRILIEGPGTEDNEVVGNDLGRFFAGFSFGGPPAKPYEHALVGIHIRNGAGGNVIGRPGAEIEVENPDDPTQPFVFSGSNGFAIGTSLVLENAGGAFDENGDLIKPNRIQNNNFGTNGTNKAIQIKGNAMGNIIGGPTDAFGNSIRANIAVDIVDNAITVPGLHNRILNNTIGYGARETGFPGFDSAINDPCNLPGPNEFGGLDYVVGVHIRGANSIGNIVGESIADSNTIEGMSIGVYIEGGGTGNIIRGNRIFGNELAGVLINASDGNTIGGPDPSRRNHIFDNGMAPQIGQLRAAMILCESENTRIQSNRFGLDLDNEPTPFNESYGIYLVNSANNWIGGPSQPSGNWIADMAEDGIRLEGAMTRNNVIQHNFIGTDNAFRDLANGGSGISVGAGAGDNRIGGRSRVPIPGTAGQLSTKTPNFIYFNTGPAVTVESGSDGNIIMQNAMASNGGKGIDLQGAGNNNQPPPAVTFFDEFAITGTVPDVESIPAESIIEVYADYGAGSLQGEEYLGAARVTTGGSWILFPLADPTGLDLVMTATHATNNDTSEFALADPSASVPPLSVARADGAAPATGTEPFFNADGEAEILALRLNTGPSSAVQINSMSFSADGTAPDPLLFDGVCLYLDADESGTFSAGDTRVAGPRPYFLDNGTVILRPDSLTLEPESAVILFVVYKRNNALGASQTFNVSILTAGQILAVSAQGEASAIPVTGAFPIRSDTFAFPEASTGGGTLPVTVTAESGGTAEGGGDYSPGSVAVLEAIPDEGYRFTGWTGDISTRGNPLSFTVSAAVSVTATFARQPRAFDRLFFELENDFAVVPGLGVIWTPYYPWVFRPGIGWLYIQEADESSIFAFAPGIGWLWTLPRGDLENFFFRMRDRVWLFYVDGEPGNRRFYNFSTEEFETGL